jgi:hypothetical protein
MIQKIIDWIVDLMLQLFAGAVIIACFALILSIVMVIPMCVYFLFRIFDKLI